MFFPDIYYLKKNNIVMGHSKITYYVVDEGGIFNVITSLDFDDSGKYIPNKSCSLSDFEIIEEFTSLKRASEFCKDKNKETN